ncbi:ligand-binding sensor domain-containing diguanylate cyclase [Arenimonas daejeonensis]|uniref:ligand-binding sensor domain-containing diguanylate cyclase n=1 Tax=Arenimonas daejeonensis TaxID=370777 RepID=UPI0011BF2B25|nr:GGDEF domain-containing protein [Arenimonas daejeonensis]
MFLNRLLRAGLLAAALCLTLPVQALAVPGAPLLRHFTADDTKTPPGHLALATGVNGELFVGSSEGVLRYDGVDWLLTPLPGRSAGRSLGAGADGLVYVGGYDTFGRLVRNGDGVFAYEELLDRAGLRNEQRHVGVVWEVLPAADGVYFRADEALHFVPYEAQAQAQRWPLAADVRSFYLAGDTLYTRVQGRGFSRFEQGRLVLEPGGEIFADQPLPGVVDRGDWRLLVGREGLYRADAEGIRAIPGAASRQLAGKGSYVVQSLSDGSFVVGTLDGELFRIGANFELRERIDLGSFGIHDLGLDREGGLWAATEGDLVRMSLPSPWSFLGAAHGLAGNPHDFEWHDGALWLATSRGVSRLVVGDDGSVRHQAHDWTEYEATSLHSSDAGLLIGLREGLKVLDPGARTPRVLYENDNDGVFGLQASTHVPGLVYAISSTELLLVEQRDKRWHVDKRIPLDGVSVNGLEETAPGVIWLGDTRGPVQRWTLDLKAGSVVDRERFADDRGLVVDPQDGTSVYQLDGRLHAISGSAGFRLEGGSFVPDKAPPVTLVDRPHELVVQSTALGDYAYTTRELWWRKDKGGEWQALYPGAQTAAGYANLRVSRDGVLRIATWNGLLQYDPDEAAIPPQPLRLSMESVVARNVEGEQLRLPNRSASAPVPVPPGHSLSLRFGMVSMESGAEFRYLLHGVTPDWSDWTDRDLFIRALPAGNYVLEVQARTRNGRQAAAMNYHFQVQPRWYEQWWLLVLGLLALAGLAAAITLWAVRQRTERYLAANRRLEGRIAERTRELEDVNRKLAELVTEDALTGVSNRRALENGLRREWFRCLDQRRPLSVLMIDVDHFKAYNDAHGHLEGDVQLKGIAQRLNQQHDPERELLARYGGEEFALLLPGVHQEEALRRAEVIRAAIAASDAGMTVSIGVAGFVPNVQSEPDSLLRRADAALYAAKRAGRNRVLADEADTAAAPT